MIGTKFLAALALAVTLAASLWASPAEAVRTGENGCVTTHYKKHNTVLRYGCYKKARKQEGSYVAWQIRLPGDTRWRAGLKGKKFPFVSKLVIPRSDLTAYGWYRVRASVFVPHPTKEDVWELHDPANRSLGIFHFNNAKPIPTTNNGDKAGADGYYLALAAVGDTIVWEPANGSTRKTFRVTASHVSGKRPNRAPSYQLCLGGTAQYGYGKDYEIGRRNAIATLGADGCTTPAASLHLGQSEDWWIDIFSDSIDDSQDDISITLKPAGSLAAKVTTSPGIGYLILNDGPLPGNYLADFGGRAAVDAFDAVSARVGASRDPGIAPEFEFDGESLAAGTVAATFGHDGGTSAAWARYTPDTVMAGLDYAQDSWMAGFAASYSDDAGEMYELPVSAALYALHPYGAYMHAGVTMWAGAGVGVGTVEVDGVSANTDFLMAAGGAARSLLALGNFELGATADALWWRLESERVTGMMGARAESERFRADLHGSYGIDAYDWGTFTPRVSTGWLYEGEHEWTRSIGLDYAHGGLQAGVEWDDEWSWSLGYVGAGETHSVSAAEDAVAYRYSRRF